MMSDFDVTIEELEAALAALHETPLRGEEDPFWRNQHERTLCNLLEMLKDSDFSS